MVPTPRHEDFEVEIGQQQRRMLRPEARNPRLAWHACGHIPPISIDHEQSSVRYPTRPHRPSTGIRSTFPSCLSCLRRQNCLTLLLAAAFLILVVPGHAGIPLPDHLLYGTIAIGGRPVTRADTNVVIEVRRGAGGPILSSYRMGSSSRLGV